MYQQVVGQSSGDKGRIMVIDIFHQNIHRLSLKSCTAFSRNFLYFCKQTVKTVFHYIIRDLIFHNSRQGSGTLGIDKGKRTVILHFFLPLPSSPENLLLFHPEADNNIRCQRNIRKCRPKFSNQFQITFFCIMAVHFL